MYMQRKLYKKLTREKFRQNASELGWRTAKIEITKSKFFKKKFLNSQRK